MAPGLPPGIALPSSNGWESWCQSCQEACGSQELRRRAQGGEGLLCLPGDGAPSLRHAHSCPPHCAQSTLGLPKRQPLTSAFLNPNTHLLAQAGQGQGPYRTGFSGCPTAQAVPSSAGCHARSGRGHQEEEKVVVLGWAWRCPGPRNMVLSSEVCVRTGTSELMPATLRPWARWSGREGEGEAVDPGLCHSLSAGTGTSGRGWAVGAPV